jgi:hypothetical protein
MNWLLLKKSTVVALCIVVGDFFALAIPSHHFPGLLPSWLHNAFHFIFWPFFITQHFFTRIGGDQPTLAEIISAGLIDLIFITFVVYLLWTLVSRMRAAR